MIYLYALIVKHVIVDLGLQSYLTGQTKYPYFSNGHVHYVQHGVTTAGVSVFFLPFELALLVGVFDYLIHWHIDFGKHRFNTYFGIVARTNAWWWTNVVDQILHFSTYLLFALTFNV